MPHRWRKIPPSPKERGAPNEASGSHIQSVFYDPNPLGSDRMSTASVESRVPRDRTILVAGMGTSPAVLTEAVCKHREM